MRHQFNVNWIWLLPFGRGRAWSLDVGGALDAFIGGWQLSGLYRWTSGFPVNADNGGQYAINYQLEGNANRLMPVTTGLYYTGPRDGPNGTTNNAAPNLFALGPAASTAFGYTFPGQTGARNQLRGPGFFGGAFGPGPSAGRCRGPKDRACNSVGRFSTLPCVGRKASDFRTEDISPLSFSFRLLFISLVHKT